MLRRGQLDDERHERGLEVIDRNARAQAQLVEDLLDMSRIITGKLRARRPPPVSRRRHRRRDRTVQPAADAKGIAIDVLDPHAPVAGDADRLQQVVWNLLSNAVKFTPKGGRVQVVSSASDSHVEIAVTDTGIGIEPRVHAVRVRPLPPGRPERDANHGGLGLGLAIVKHLVELHGGTVTVASNGTGSGSTFTVMLPVPALLDASAGPGHAARQRSVRHPPARPIDPRRG